MPWTGKCEQSSHYDKPLTNLAYRFAHRRAALASEPSLCGSQQAGAVRRAEERPSIRARVHVRALTRLALEKALFEAHSVSGAARVHEHRHAVGARATVNLNMVSVSEIIFEGGPTFGARENTHPEGVSLVELVARAVAGDVQSGVTVALAAAEGCDSCLCGLRGERGQECRCEVRESGGRKAHGVKSCWYDGGVTGVSEQVLVGFCLVSPWYIYSSNDSEVSYTRRTFFHGITTSFGR